MREITCELKFKKELSNIELCGIEYILNGLGLSDGDFLGLVADDWGLAYTSSSSYAMYNVTEKIWFEIEKEVSHFAITENNMLIMVCTDDKEREYLYEVETADYDGSKIPYFSI